MSHFSAYILVSGSTNYVRGRVSHLMAPYDNAFEVEEYETECDCIGHGQAPDPDCEDCGGTGKHLTTFNPMAKLDGYTIADYQHVLRAAATKPSEWANDYEDRTGMALLSNLEFEKLELPHVIVTPSGEWHEMQGDWYSDDRDSADWQEWKSTVKEIYAKWPSAILVVVNCHQ
jgi:hypothetical protein